MSKTDIEEGSIDYAIRACQTIEDKHLLSAAKMLRMVFGLTIILVGLLIVAFVFPYVISPLSLSDSTPTTVPDTVLYVFLAIYTLSFSVLMAIYRLHISEISRIQHHKIGFMRIRVAGNNTSPGYQGNVREALVSDAFDYFSKPEKSGFKKSINNPIPGHPGAEITTALLNKILEAVDVVSKKEKKVS